MSFILLGLVCGLLSGLFGIGGGSVYVPLLVLFFHLTQQAAQGLSLLVMIPTALLGGSIYIKHKNVQTDLLPTLIMGGICGAFLGSFIANQIPSLYLSKIFSILLIYFGIQMISSKK